MVHTSSRSRSLSRVAALLTLVWMSLGGFPASASAAVPGAQLWAKPYNGPADGTDYASALGVSPDGSEVFVTGRSPSSTTGVDYTTVAHDASTGVRRWVSRSDGGFRNDYATAIGVSPDGSEVFVTGYSSWDVGVDYLTVALDANTGSPVWATTYNDSADGFDYAMALGVSPDGSQVFVTGYVYGSTGDYATVAYDAATGTQLWARRYNGPGNDQDEATALGVSPDGSRVFVTGQSVGSTGTDDYATVAYDASTGAKLWAKRYDRADEGDSATALGVSPDGSEVFVTGFSDRSPILAEYATVAYDASTGTQLWARRYNGVGNGNELPHALGVSPDGSEVFVTGQSVGSTGFDYATVAYDASTGTQLWSKRYNGPGKDLDIPYALGVSPDGSEVFVTGQSVGSTGTDDYATVAYDASAGAKLGVKRYDGTGHGSDSAYALGVSPDGSEVFVTGLSFGSATSGYDYATVAYGVT
jgi:outer membrane protein assembly factor BamB